jgi:glycosyltransferase involved in cell wall biosynthesis
MTEMPLVSVLMTSYNRERYIVDAIESVLASTYGNFELIIIDDCSTDNTYEIALKYATKDKRVKVYLNAENLGDYPNRNKAAGYASGKYLKYVDSDDMIYPHGLQVFVDCMEKFPSAALGFGYHKIQLENPFPVLVPKSEALRNHFFTTGFLNTGPTGVIIRRDAFERAGKFTGKRMVGDTELWFAISCQHDCVIVPPSLVYWRQHEGQEFFDGVRSGLYAEMTLKILYALMDRPDCTLTEEEKKKVLKYYRKVTSRLLLKLAITKREPAKSWKIARELRIGSSDFIEGIVNIRKGIND